MLLWGGRTRARRFGRWLALPIHELCGFLSSLVPALNATSALATVSLISVLRARARQRQEVIGSVGAPTTMTLYSLIGSSDSCDRGHTLKQQSGPGSTAQPFHSPVAVVVSLVRSGSPPECDIGPT